MQINDLATHTETYINDINVFFTVLSKNPATHLIALYFAWEQKGEMGANIHGNTVHKTKMTTTLPLRPFWWGLGEQMTNWRTRCISQILCQVFAFFPFLFLTDTTFWHCSLFSSIELWPLFLLEWNRSVLNDLFPHPPNPPKKPKAFF